MNTDNRFGDDFILGEQYRAALRYYKSKGKPEKEAQIMAACDIIKPWAEKELSTANLTDSTKRWLEGVLDEINKNLKEDND